MKSLTLSQVLSLLTLSFVASIIPACGGGSSEKALVAQPPLQAPPTVGKMHVSAPLAGPVNCPVNSSILLRTVVFTPTSPDDIILYVLVEGKYTSPFSSTSFGFYSIDLQDADGNSLGSMLDSVPNRLPGADMPFRMYGQPFQESGNAHFFSEGKFPSTSYKILVYVTAGTSAGIDTKDLVVKIVTLEGVQVVSPSSQITG